MPDREIKDYSLRRRSCKLHAHDSRPVLQASGTSPARLSWASLCSCALGYYFWPMLNALVTDMANNENYSSGLLIPLVIGYIVYRKWPELRQPWQPSWWGLAVMALGFGIFFLGAVLTIEYISRLAMVVVLAGVLWLVGGWRLVRLLGFPLLLLAMVIPLPQMVLSRLTLKMQLASSQLAADMLRCFGYPVGSVWQYHRSGGSATAGGVGLQRSGLSL